VLRTAVGYAGGHSPNPTYHDLADHAEAVQVEFDPQVIDFETLLHMFWDAHDPTSALRSSQYRAELFCADEGQLAIAEASAETIAAKYGSPVATALRLRVPFHLAEDYHQKWRLRRHTALWQELQTHYMGEQALLGSTAAAKLNGYVSGGASRAQVERDLALMGLSDEANAGLIAAHRRKR